MNAMTMTRRTGRMLGADEEAGLFTRHAKGDGRATRIIVDAHVPLVNKIAGRYSGFGPNHEEIVQEGMVGFVQGLDRYDPTLGYRINTFCRWWVRAAISEWVRSNHSLIRIGTTAAQKKAFGSLADAKARLGIYDDQRLSGADLDRLSAILAIPREDVAEMNLRMSPMAITSLDAPVPGDDAGARIERMADERSDVGAIDEGIDDRRRREALEDALSILDARKRDIVRRRYLADDVSTLEDLSTIHGVSRERIRQLEVQAIEQLGLALPAGLSNLAGQERRSARAH